MRFGEEVNEAITAEEIETEEAENEILDAENAENTELSEENQNEDGEFNIDIALSSRNSSIYKGYLYANTVSDLRYETNYNTIETVNISGNEYIDRVIFNENDSISLNTGVSIELDEQINYKKTRILVEEFENILGEDGSIGFYDGQGNYLGEINSESEIKNDYYVFEYAEDYDSVIIDILNPINDGELSILNDKAIKEETEFTNEQISTFTSIDTVSKFSVVSGNEVSEYEAKGSVLLEETESKMTLEIDNPILSTEYSNDVAINVALKTDEEKYNLFTNPVIELEFPSAINDVQITGVNLLYKNGLSLKNWKTFKDDNGNIVLRIELSGSQSVYTPGSAAEGTTVAIYTKVINNRLTSNGVQTLKLTYTNENLDRIAYLLDGKDAEEIELSFMGKEELITSISAQNSKNGDSVTGFDGETTSINIDYEGESQNINISGTILNNFQDKITDVYIIGKIPFENNTDTDGYNLNTNFNTSLINSITASGLESDIYYSTAESPTKDDESWSQDLSNIANYKSYKIEIKNGEINPAEYLSFNYNIQIPENIGFNAKAYSAYTVYYFYDGQEISKKSTIGMVSEEKEVVEEDLDENAEVLPETGEVVDTSQDNQDENLDQSNEEENNNEEEIEEQYTLSIRTGISAYGENLSIEDSVYERQILKYTIAIRNNSNKIFTNINIRGNAENSNIYYKRIWELTEEDGYVAGTQAAAYEEDLTGEKTYEEFQIESLAPGESATFTFQAVVREGAEEVFGNITISGDDIVETSLQTIKLKVNQAKLEIRVGYSATEPIEDIPELSGSGMELYAYLKNISGETLTNVVLTIVLPPEISYRESYTTTGADGLEYDITSTSEGGQYITFYIHQMEVNDVYKIDFWTLITDLDLDILETTTSFKGYATVDGEIYYSNVYSKDIKQRETYIDYTWEASVPGDTLVDGQEVTYTFTLTNLGLVTTGNSLITGYIPDGLELQNVSVALNDGTEVQILQDNTTIYCYVDLDPNETVTFTASFIHYQDLLTLNQTTIENQISVTGVSFESFDTDIITYNVTNKYDTSTDTPTPGHPDVPEAPDVPTEDLPADDNNTNNENNTNNNDNNSSNSGNNSNTVNILYRISGLVWIDRNKDGINKSENGMEGVNVYLYSVTSQGSILNQVAETVTNESGEYIFTGLSSGYYAVCFEYDNNLYAVTTYQVSTALSSQNSDVISKTIDIDGEAKNCGVTDTLDLTRTNLTNIDMGLAPLNDFDLSLEKYISQVIVRNESGESTYRYDSSDSEKVEIRSRYYESSTLEITYNIVIRNEGDVSGYINRIVDYLPDGVEINLDNNPGWYYTDDGNLGYNGLMGTEIEAGSSQTIQLIVTQSLASGESMNILNSAEIAEATNSFGYEDLDSTPLNNVPEEDDQDDVSLLVTISTGALKENITVLVVLLIIAFLIILIKKNKITLKKVYK